MDSQITALLSARDEKALQLLRDTYGGFCHSLAFQIIGNHQDAEECVNDTLLAVWNSSATVRADTLRGYLAALVRRTAIDRLKAQTAQKRGGTHFAAALDELADILPSDDQVERQIEQRELTEALTAFLRTLPQDAMRIFMQRYYLSRPVQEIAEKNNMGKSAVKMSLMRTRNKLKDYLQKEGLL